MRAALTVLFCIVLLYIIMVYILFNYIFNRNPGVVAKLLNRLMNNDFLAGHEQEAAKGVEWSKNQRKEEVSIKSFDSLTLTGYFFENPRARRTILCAHGYRGDCFRDFSVALRLFYENLDSNLLVINQRAHSTSEGRYITYGINEGRDLVLWANYLKERLGENHPVFLDGISMGASSVLCGFNWGYPENVKGAIADCGFTSPMEIIQKVFYDGLKIKPHLTLKILCVFAKGFAKTDLTQNTSIQGAEKCTLPIIFAHGTSDGFVPYEMGERMFSRCKSSEKCLICAKGAAHGMSFFVSFDEYLNKVTKMLEKYS